MSLYPSQFLQEFLIFRGFSGGSVVKNPPANAGDTVSIPGLGRSPGGGYGNPLQYSYPENPMDREAWQATVHGVAKELDTTEHTRGYVDKSLTATLEYAPALHIPSNSLEDKSLCAYEWPMPCKFSEVSLWVSTLRQNPTLFMNFGFRKISMFCHNACHNTLALLLLPGIFFPSFC